MIEPYYTVDQVAERVAVNPETVRREVSKGRLQCIRFGSRMRFPESAVKEWLDAKREQR